MEAGRQVCGTGPMQRRGDRGSVIVISVSKSLTLRLCAEHS